MKILTLDIETSPHQGYSFQVWQTNIAPGQIIAPTQMLTWSAKWKGARKCIFRKWTDGDFLDKLHELLNEADIIVTYNGDKFDLRHINREFLEAGLFPTRPVASVDMLKVVKKHFAFPHNRLDYVASRLLGETKLETGGFDLWTAFMSGDRKAERLMERYNKRDIVLTEKLYIKLLPWITNHPYALDYEVDIGDENVDYRCPACGSRAIERQRPRRTRCYAIRVNRCTVCGSFHDGKRKKL